jgi:CheY-like chemotaxis protein
MPRVQPFLLCHAYIMHACHVGLKRRSLIPSNYESIRTRTHNLGQSCTVGGSSKLTAKSRGRISGLREFRSTMNAGYEVRTSEDGFSALVQLRAALPDLIVSDLRMPNMSGFELLSIIRRRFPQIPVIAQFTPIEASVSFADSNWRV